MVGSVLTVNVIEARELKSTRITGGVNPYVLISIEEQKQATDQVGGSNEPVWNEIISFDIMTG